MRNFTHRRKIGLLLIAALASTLASCSCSSNNSSSGFAQENSEATAGWNQIVANQPVPVFATSALRLEVIEIEAVQALGSPTTSFFMPEGSTSPNAHPIKSCPSEGESIPGGSQLDNPEQIIKDTHPGYNNSTSLAIPQGDPNGIYLPQTAAQTYVVCVDASGKPRPSSWEGPVEVEVGAARWDSSLGQIVDYGPNQLPACTILTARSGDGSGVQAGKQYYHCVKA